jgi:hypothetical protein
MLCENINTDEYFGTINCCIKLQTKYVFPEFFLLKINSVGNLTLKISCKRKGL